MSDATVGSALDGVTAGLRRVVCGDNDTRVRATWRVLLAMPVLWVFTGGILTGNLQSALPFVPSGPERFGGLAQSLLHAGFLVVVLAAWARYLDRRPLSTYGVSLSVAWFRDVLVGFAAVLVGSVVWLTVTAAVGGTSVAVAPSRPSESLLVAFVVPFVAFALHAVVQQIVFFEVILGTAAEGLHSRGLTARRAALGAVPIAVLFFVLMHSELTALRTFDLMLAGGIFALLSLHTGELAVGIGAHTGSLYGGIVLSSVVEVTGSLAGVLGTVDAYGFPALVGAYAVLVGWLRWRQGTLSVRSGMARWTSA